MTVALDIDAWPDPAAWGIALVDLVRHLSAGYAQKQGADSGDVAARIREAFDVEWSHPTDGPE